MKAIIFAVFALAILSCSGVQSVSASGTVTGNPTSGEISATIGVVVTFAQVADAALIPYAAQDSQLNDTQKAQVETALTDTAHTLQVLSDANTAYQHIASADNKCKLLAALDAALQSRTDVMTLLLGFGVPIPAQAQLAVQAIGAMADSLVGYAEPGCATDGGAPGMRLRNIRARLRLQ